MTLKLYLRYKNSGATTITHIARFTLLKDAYTPYSMLTVTFFRDMNSIENIYDAEFSINDKTHHRGIVDTINSEMTADGNKITITSRGYTSLLTENQLEPKMYNDITFNQLFDNYIKLPKVYHESNSQSSYIYVKSGTPMWDGVVNLSYKLTGKYPYVRNENKVMMSMPTDTQSLNYYLSEVISRGTAIDTRHIVSHYHMADLKGEYGTFDYSENYAVSRDIIRHRRFELDKRFLNSPINACNFRGDISMRTVKRDYIVYNGFKDEDINDIASYNNDIVKQRIKRLKVIGNRKGIITEVSFYTDSFS